MLTTWIVYSSTIIVLHQRYKSRFLYNITQPSPRITVPFKRGGSGWQLVSKTFNLQIVLGAFFLRRQTRRSQWRKSTSHGSGIEEPKISTAPSQASLVEVFVGGRPCPRERVDKWAGKFGQHVRHRKRHNRDVTDRWYRNTSLCHLETRHGHSEYIYLCVVYFFSI